MKPHRIIITRNTNTCNSAVSMWPVDANPTLQQSGYWEQPGVKAVGCYPGEFKAVFGFLPRKGSKKVYEMREAKK